MEQLREIIEPVSALASVLAGFALILLLTRLKVPVWGSILLGAAVVALLFGRSLLDTLALLCSGCIQRRTVALIAVVALLLALSQAMRQTGRIDRMVTLMRSILRRPAVAMSAMPAMIGLIPMPGGALFSAPMVATASAGVDVPGSQLSAINFWYRHLWEYWWPLYPGVIVGMEQAGRTLGVDQLTFVVGLLPMSLVMAASGLWIFRGLHPDLHVHGPRPSRGTKRQLAGVMMPIWLIVLIWGGCRLALWQWPLENLDAVTQSFIKRYVVILLAVATSLAWTVWRGRLDAKQIQGLFVTKSAARLVLVVISAMVFMYALGVVDAGSSMGAEMKDLGMPVVVVVAVLPFIAGMVLGVAVGFVGTSFPIVLPLAAGNSVPVAYVMLAYAFGHMGQMLSPIHICQIVTLEYFKSSYREVYPRIIPPAILTAAGACGLFVLMKMVLG